MLIVASNNATGKVLGVLLAISFLVWLVQKIGGHLTGTGVCPYCGKGLKTNAVACHHCGHVHPKRAKHNTRAEWRCEKHGHLLEKSRTTCPIDGSPARWTTPKSE
jgi:hypothetical protein